MAEVTARRYRFKWDVSLAAGAERTLRILSLCDGFLPNALGGVEVLSYHLLRALRTRGHAVLVPTSCLKSETPGPQSFDGFDLVKIQFNEALASRHLATIHKTRLQVAALIHDFAPDVIHLNDVRPSSFFFLRRGDTAGVPRVLTIHSPIRELGSDGLQNRLVAEADRVIAVSRAQQADALARIPGAKGKTTVIHNALPLPERPPSPPPFDPPRLLCVGRIVPEKGFDVALRAVAALAARGLRLDLAIAGDGSEMEALRALAGALGIADQLRFLGWAAPEAVAALMDAATLVLVPSRWPEPFGLVALQAQQMARPVIASDVGGLNEVVAHGETGLLVAPDDAAALATAIEAMLADPAAVRRMGEAARRRAREAFDFDTLVLSHERIFVEAQRAVASAAMEA